MDVAKREATQRRVVASRLVTLFLAGWASAPPAPDCHQPIDQAVFRYNYTLRPKFEIKPFSSAACHRRCTLADPVRNATSLSAATVNHPPRAEFGHRDGAGIRPRTRYHPLA